MSMMEMEKTAGVRLLQGLKGGKAMPWDKPAILNTGIVFSQ